MYRTASLLSTLSVTLALSGLVQAADEIALFNGKDLSGWTCCLKEPDAKMKDVWSVSGGVLRCEGQPIGYLRTEKEYTNYILKLQWRWPQRSKPTNSGVLLRMVGPDRLWPKFVEAQLEHRCAGDILNIGKPPLKADPLRTHGGRTDKMKPSNERPPGEWNQYEITLKGGSLTLKVNGQLQNTATQVEEVPGTIALQSEGGPIEFRNIRLTPLRTKGDLSR